jgi:3'(2'), 5'-bisphosphate nucleotidase
MTDLSSEQLQKIRWLLHHCGQQATQLASEPFQIFEKGEKDYVTTVDQILDAQLATGFTALFPSDGVITEENAQSRELFAAACDRLWLIDPIDGTDDYIQRKDHYAIMVGVLENHQPTAGWVYAPALDHLYYGGQAWGLFQATDLEPPEPLVPVEPPPPSATFCPILIGNKDQKNYGDLMAQLIPGIRFDSVGSFGLKVVRVICGQAGLYVYLNGRVKLWDTVGPLALAKAAGLVCCDLTGEPLHFTPDAVDLETLAHRQTIVIGWPSYVEALRSRLLQAFNHRRAN